MSFLKHRRAAEASRGKEALLLDVPMRDDNPITTGELLEGLDASSAAVGGSDVASRQETEGAVVPAS
jgi:hypothetical protein